MASHLPRATLLLALMMPGMALASEFDGAVLSLVWSIPFIGMLLSIALLPMLAPLVWHHRVSA